MTTGAVAIRDAIYDRLAHVSDYNRTRKTHIRQLQAEDLPALTVVIMTENMVPDGDYNAGVPSFVSDVTVGISIVRGFKTPEELDIDIDGDANLVLDTLLTDPGFVGFGSSDPDDPNYNPGYFEGITRIDRRRNEIQNGETYLLELRQDITFLTRCYFEPVVPDHYKGMTVTTRPAVPKTQDTPPAPGAPNPPNPGTPAITKHIDEPDWT